MEAEKANFEAELSDLLNKYDNVSELAEDIRTQHALSNRVIIVLEPMDGVTPGTFNYPIAAVFKIEESSATLVLDVYFSGKGGEGGIAPTEAGAFTCRQYEVALGSSEVDSADTSCPSDFGDQSREHLVL